MISPRVILSFLCSTTIAFFGVASSPAERPNILEKSYIDEINRVATTWKAGENFGPDTTWDDLRGLLGSKGVRKGTIKKPDNFFISVNVPDEFDARENWEMCSTIGMVHDQANCACCWAFSTSEALADRLCIATDGEFNQMLSAENLAFCCDFCGNGCNEGYPIKAWQQMAENGVVTGGDYGSKEGCQPYRVHPCDEDHMCQGMEKNHECLNECYGNTSIDYESDLNFASNAYYLDYEQIQLDIMLYGPVEASFNLHQDFYDYKFGVYQKTEDAQFVGEHSVKCIGWGVEDDTPYWLMVNSWKDTWGDKGLFKIRRGTNECGVDNSFTAGQART